MSKMDENCCWRQKVLEEQLVSLSLIVDKCLSQDLNVLLNNSKGNLIATMNVNTFNVIIYFLLGVINKEERDKIMKWPVLNIATKTKFRKDCVSMVKKLQEKFPWANVLKVPESQLLDPNGHKLVILDFLLSLTCLTTHLVLENDPPFTLANIKGLSKDEKEIQFEIVSSYLEHEHSAVLENVMPVDSYDSAVNSMLQKCVQLKEEISQNKRELVELKNELVAEGLIPNNCTEPQKELEAIFKLKMDEVKSTAEILGRCADLSSHVTSAVKAAKTPVILCADDIGMNNIQHAANVAADKLRDLSEDWRSHSEACPQDMISSLQIPASNLRDTLSKLCADQATFINTAKAPLDGSQDIDSQFSILSLENHTN